MIWIFEILAFNLAIVFVTELTASFAFGAATWRKIATVALINIITNPPVVLSSLCLTLFFEAWHDLGIVVLEVVAVIIEGFMFSKFKTFDNRNPYFVSFVLNAISFSAGELIKIFDK